MEININCDLGESSKLHSTENDPLLLEIVNSANIACGYLAVDKATKEKTIEISKKNIIGHSDVAPARKIDPGEKFPWKYLAKNKVGIWHDYEPNLLRKFRRTKVLTKQDKKRFVKNLNQIGYCFSAKNKLFFIKTIKAFQRHFRKELIYGILDQECFMIAQNLAKKL